MEGVTHLKFHEQLDVEPWSSLPLCDLLCFLHLFVELVEQSLDGRPVIDVHLFLLPTQCMLATDALIREFHATYTSGKPPHTSIHYREVQNQKQTELTLISSHVSLSSSNLRSFALLTTRLSSSESESLDPTMNLHNRNFLSTAIGDLQMRHKTRATSVAMIHKGSNQFDGASVTSPTCSLLWPVPRRRKNWTHRRTRTPAPSSPPPPPHCLILQPRISNLQPASTNTK